MELIYGKRNQCRLYTVSRVISVGGAGQCRSVRSTAYVYRVEY